MSTELNKIADSLFEKIRSRFDDISLGDENAKATQKPEDARFFNFDYIVDGKNHGNVTISIIDERALKIYFSKNISLDLDDHEKQDWTNFLKNLRFFAKRNLLNFEPRDITRSTLKHRDVKQLSNNDDTYSKDDVKLGESWTGTKRSSFENKGPVKIIVRHNKIIDEETRGARSRNIHSIFLETHEGERFKLPENNLKLARAMARHISEGGSMHDEFGQHILEISREYSKLRPFKNSMMRRTFEDSETQQMVEAAFEYHGLLNNTLKRMSGKKGYKHCKENFKNDNVLMDDFDVNELKERFVKRVYNDKVEDALPLVQKAYIMKKQNKFADQFESWANSIVDDDYSNPDKINDIKELLSSPLPVGVDAINAINAIEGLISDDGLIEDLEVLASQDPEADAREEILGWLQSNEYSMYQEIIKDLDDNFDDEVSEGFDDDYNDEDDYEDDEDQGFFVVIAGEHSGAFIGMVYKEGSKWRERAISGKPPYNWGTSYMGYLKPNDVMQWIEKDYGRHAEVSGPYSSQEEAREYAEYNYWGDESEVDEAKGDIRKALAGAALAGGMALSGHALNKMDQEVYANSPQLQKLEQLHSQALKVGHTKLAKEIENRIENHKTRLSLGKGDIQDKSGNPIEVHESVTDILKLAGLK